MKRFQKIKENDWHFWGRWMDTVFFSSLDLATSKSEIYKELNLDSVLRGDAKVTDGYYFSLESDLERIGQLIDDYFEGKNKWLDIYFKVCERETEKLVKLENKNDLKILAEQLLECVSCSKIINFLDDCISRHLVKLGQELNISYATILAWIKPGRNTQLMRYKRELEKLNDDEINNFIKKYEWVGTKFFVGRPLSKKQVKEELKALHKYKSREIINNTPSKFNKIIKIASELTYQRTNLSEVIIRVSYSYWRQIKDYLKNYGLKFSDIGLFTYFEFLDLLKGKSYPKGLYERKNGFSIEFISGKWNIFTGSEIDNKILQKKFIFKKKELKGIPANFGKLKGKTRILNSLADAINIKKGDIIVASEITTDYILILSKVSAIITEQGGITSHAAIIARELKKPCIVGVKMATKILKDGDRVEVDANNGIIKKI